MFNDKNQRQELGKGSDRNDNDNGSKNGQNNKSALNPPTIHTELSRGRKAVAVILGFFGIFVIILWTVQFKKSITESLNYGGSPGSDKLSAENSASLADREKDLRSRDTDGDGLSDWDELNIYKTSPYLEDSDSDGFTDKEEVDSGNDPNCPAGRDCYGDNLSSPAGQAKDKQNKTDIFNRLNNSTNQSISSNTLKAVSSLNLDASSLRKILIEVGMDKKVLEQISDEDLMSSWREVVGGEK